MSEPSWLKIARSYEGLKEIPGPRHNQTIIRWLGKLKAWWSDDETPWCGVFVAGLGTTGIAGLGLYNAMNK